MAAAGAAPGKGHVKHATTTHQAAKGEHAGKAKHAPKKPKQTAGAATTISVADAPALNWGVADDASKYANDGGSWFYGQLKGANLTENRWTLAWNPSNPTAITELPFVQRAAPIAQAAGIHVVIALYAGTNGTSTPDANHHDATAFCTWAKLVAQTVKVWGIRDFIVWNEPSSTLYWNPQKSGDSDVAAAPYENLLATCYDSLHSLDGGGWTANVIGMGLSAKASKNTSNQPLAFLRDVGAAYKASGRATPIMDQLALHPYPFPSSTPSPDKGYTNTPDAYGPPDLDRVKQAVYDAFNGTGQPTTLNGLTFRLDEFGWQTNQTGQPGYTGTENAGPPGSAGAIDQATQSQYLQQAVQMFACDATVTDVELFLLIDEANLAGWQSGLLTTGGEGVSTAKQAYGDLAPKFAQGRAACTTGVKTWSPAGSSGAGGNKGGGSGSTGKGSGKGSAGKGTTGKSAGKSSGACTKKTKLKKGYVCKNGKVAKKAKPKPKKH
ncbi:MAG TPA: hypothetical protein VFJ91_04475 [Gaiellaceae bacterium]|nr:hypothetical protein [Gaiellaceae bacterium]